MSQYVVKGSGETLPLIFREARGFHVPGCWSAYYLHVGSERWGLVSHIRERPWAWAAISYSQLTMPLGLLAPDGFSTRRDAGFYVVRTYGRWAESQ